MEYKISPEFSNLVNSFKKQLISNFIFITFIYITSSLLIYSVSKTPDLPFCVTEVLLFAALGFIIYSQIVPKGKIIAKTAIGLAISPKEITVTMSAFKLLFWIDAPQKQIAFQMDKLNIRETNYEIKQIYDLDKGVFKISNKSNDVYIIADFFNKGLYDKLSELKVS